MKLSQVKYIVEGALLTAHEPLQLNDLKKLFEAHECPAAATLEKALMELTAEKASRPVFLQQVASGYRYQLQPDLMSRVQQLSESRRPNHSQAFMETLALIAYRQPITRGEIEQMRGVTTVDHIMRTLLANEWVRIMGRKEVVGYPALYGTTKKFLDDFNLKDLAHLPPLPAMPTIDEMMNTNLYGDSA